MWIKDRIDGWVEKRLQDRLEREKREVTRLRWQKVQMEQDLARMKERHDRQQAAE